MGDVAAGVEQPAPFSGRRLVRFVWAHKGFLLAAPVLVVLGTLIHELAHAVAVWAQGGVVTGFVIVPTGGAWGRMSYLPDPKVEGWWVSIAPLLLWTALAIVAGLALGSRGPGKGAKLLFLTFFVLPTLDVAMSFSGLYEGSTRSDFHQALAGTERQILPFVIAYFLLFAGWGWRLFRRIAPRELGAGDFLLGYAGLIVLTCLF